MKKYFRFTSLLLILTSSFLTSTADSQEFALGENKVKYNLYSRSRYEFENWYGNSTQDTTYTIPSEKVKFGVELSRSSLRLAIQGQYMGIWNLKTNEPGPASSFFGGNDGSQSPWAISLRQALLEYNDEELKVFAGRQNYFSGEGGTIPTSHKELTFLSKSRIAQRVIGASEFTAGRSFDGIKFDVSTNTDGSLQIGAFHPTQGAASVAATRQISEIDIGVLSYTHKVSMLSSEQDGQMQFFYYYYGDRRGLTKTDNRDALARSADTSTIELHTTGAHWIQSYDVSGDQFDTTLWGVLQTGEWGNQHHEAWAGVFELGYRFRTLPWMPWLRAGINTTSGDNSPTNSNHSTFFQLINTPRNYALVPFFNMQNMNDRFVQVITNPASEITFRSDLHSLSLTARNDLLYSGGGASTKGSFGYSGLSTNGETSVGTMFDLGVTWQVSKYVTLDGYLGHVWGGAALSEVSTNGNSDITFAFLDCILQMS